MTTGGDGEPGPAPVLAITWPRPGVAELRAAGPPVRRGPGEVTVDLACTVTSSGTERARFLALPNASVGFPHVPGYMGSGVVTGTDAGPSVPVGSVVAVRGAPHKSTVVAPAAHVHAVPHGVAAEDAALWQLGLTALHGLWRGGYDAGEPVRVVGAGLLGAIVRRIVIARGSRVTVMARSRAKAWAVNDPGATFVTAGEVAADGAPRLVVDATGTAEGLCVAAGATATGGTVVLLGSPRAALAPLPARDLHDRGLRVVGAHIDTLAAAGGNADALTAEWFRLLAAGLTFTDLLERHAPGEAPAVYRRLSGEPGFVGAVFDWRAASAAPASTPVRASLRRGRRRLRVAVLGCGDIGHVDAAAVAASASAELVAAFDPVADLARDVADRFGGDVCRTAAEVVAREDVDALVIATPHDRHEELAVAGLAAGKHVLLEKPLAADLAAARRIAAAPRRGGAVAGALFPLRFEPAFAAARHAIETGRVGAVVGAVSTYLVDKPPSYYASGYSNRSQSTWRSSKARAGGGVIVMNVLHHIDAVRSLVGRDATVVFARTVPAGSAAEIDDVGALIVDFDGVVATFVGAASVVGGPGESVRIWGTAGHLELLPKWHAASRRHAVDPPQPSGADPRVLAIEDFALAAADGRQPAVSLADALGTQVLVDAAYRSAASGAAVAL